MVGISKEDVLNWYQGLNASHRLETICALLDHSLPFELRFLGSVIENLGRKDFHVLRDAECRTNSLHSSDLTPDHAAILKLLSEGPAPAAMTLNPQMMTSGVGVFNSHSTNANEVSSARPSPTIDQRTSDASKGPSDAPKSSENGLLSKSSTLLASESSGKRTEQSNLPASANHTELNIEENRDSKPDIWLHDGAKRRKLILYLSLLAATNHESANLYYILLSEVEDLMESLEWLEGSDQMVQDEIQLLYTIGSQHPAFNFEQRTFLSTVLNRFKECMSSCSKHSGQNFHDSPSPPNQILNHHYLPPQHFEGKFGGYYYYAPQHVQNIQCTQQSTSQSMTTGSSEGVRTQAYPSPFVSYPNFPVFMSPPHPHHPPMGHPFQGHPFAATVMGSSLPVHGSVLQAHPFPQQVPMVPTSGSIVTSSPNAVGHPLVGNKVQLQSPTQSTVHQQSHQSSVSTPTRTSSLASGVTAFQSQTNSIDGDSEESSENCAWDSPESSPFESPPQSLTPSRSQSPRGAGVHARNTVQAPPTTQCSNVTSPVCGITQSSNTSANSLHSITNCERLSNSNIISSMDQGSVITSSSSQSVTLSKPQPKSIIPERKGRPYIAGVSTLSNLSPLSSTHILPTNSGISSSTTTPSTSLTVSTVPMTNLSPLLSSQSSTSQRLGQTQCATVTHSHSSQCMPPPCSSNNASYTNSTSNISSSGDSAQIHKSITCSISSANIVTSGISSPSSSTVNTSAYCSNNFNTISSISSSANPYPVPLPQHHVANQTMITAANSYSGETFSSGNPTTMGLVNTVNINTSYGNPHKSSSSMHSQSQGRMQPKLNTVPNHNQQSSNQLGAQVQHSQQQHVIQQLMGQVVGQPSSSSMNNLVGVVTHSISMNTPLLSYGHPPGALNSHGHTNYSAYSPTGVAYGAGMGGSFRPSPQTPLLNRPAAFMPSHPGSIMNNQMVMKQQQQHDQRSHSGGHSSLRQKNPTAMQNHNTPKRRNSNIATSSVSNPIVNTNIMTNNSNLIISQSQTGKPEETNDIKDRTNNILVVSANPPKNSQQQDNRGKIYHHPNSGFSNGPIPIGERVSSGSSSTSNTMMNSSTGNPVPNNAVPSSVAPGQALCNSQTKCEENLQNDVGMMDYGIATASQLPAYHSSGPIYGHPGPTFIPMQNGFLPQSYYPNHVTGQSVGMNSAGGPPSTEILMNPGHAQPHYPFTFPFTIPPQHYANSSIASKAVCANNTVTKDSNKTPLPVMGAVGSPLSSDSSKLVGNVNDTGPGVPFGRSGPTTNSQVAASIGVLGLTNPPSLIPMSSHSPMTAQPVRSRGVVLEVGGQATNAEFPSLSSLENALMPPLEDPVEINCRPRKISCYNCGSNAHLGPECKEASMEEMTRKQYRLNYGGPSSAESKEGE